LHIAEQHDTQTLLCNAAARHLESLRLLTGHRLEKITLSSGQGESGAWIDLVL
jgi:hypothetical protein